MLLFVVNNVSGGNDFENRVWSKKHWACAVTASLFFIFELAPYVYRGPLLLPNV